jgi:hypothetical protein
MRNLGRFLLYELNVHQRTSDFCLWNHTGCYADMGLVRYKLVLQVALGQNKDQTVRVSSQCLWESDVDNSAQVNYKSVRNNSLKR